MAETAQNGEMQVIICFDEATRQRVGYCISSLDHDLAGEIESIFVLPEYRGLGIGKELMRRTLQWLDEAAQRKWLLVLPPETNRLSLL